MNHGLSGHTVRLHGSYRDLHRESRKKTKASSSKFTIFQISYRIQLQNIHSKEWI